MTTSNQLQAAAWQHLQAYLDEDSYDGPHDLAHRRFNEVEEHLVRTERSLAPLSYSTTPEGYDRYWQTVAAEYVRRYGLPTLAAQD